MHEDLTEIIDYMQVLRLRIRLLRAFTQITRMVLINSSPENDENPRKNRVNQKITKNNGTRKLMKSKKKNENSIKIKERQVENKRNKKKHVRNGKYVLNVARV